MCVCVLIHCLIQEEFPCGVFLAASLSTLQQFQLVAAFWTLLWVFLDRRPHLRHTDSGWIKQEYFDANYHVLNQEFQENVLSIGKKKDFTLER